MRDRSGPLACVRAAPAAIALLLAAGGGALAGPTRVSVDLPVPAKIDLSGYRTVLVARFLAPEHPRVEVGDEFVRWVRRELSKHSKLKVLDVPPPALPEQPAEELVRNYVYWKRIAEEHGADLVVSGRIVLATADRSGFVQEDVVSPITGQKVRRTRFAEREEFTFEANLWFFQGLNGAFLYEDTFRNRQVYEGKSNDPLQIFYNLAEKLVPDLAGVVAPQRRRESRTIFDE